MVGDGRREKGQPPPNIALPPFGRFVEPKGRPTDRREVTSDRWFPQGGGIQPRRDGFYHRFNRLNRFFILLVYR